MQSIEVISPGFNQFDGTTQVFQHYFFYDMNKQYLGSYTIELNIQMNGIKAFKRYYNVTNPPVNYSQHGVSDAGGHAVGFDNEKSGWGFVAGNAHFYLADFFQPIGTYWDAKPKTPFGGDGFNGLLSNAISQSQGWNQVRSLQTTYPPLTAQQTIVQPGDTINALEDRFAISDTQKDMLSLYNGKMPGTNDVLSPAMDLLIPPYKPITNTARSSLPYVTFMSIMVKNAGTFLKQPEQHTSFLEELVSVVAVVVAVVAAPYMAPALFTTVGPLALSVTAAVTAGVVDAVGQGILVAAGLESQFQLADVFNSALSAAMAVDGGLMDGLKLGSNVILSAALRAGASNLILQLAELSEGMITQIDLKSLLSSMIGAGLGRELFSSTKAISVAEERAEIAANSVMGGFIDSAIEGKGIDLKNLFTNLLQSEAEDMLTAGRKAMSQADNAKQASQPNLAKIPAPEDTGTRKQSKSSRYANSNTNSNANVNSNNSANDDYLGSYASANTNAFANSLNQNLKTQDHYESDPHGWTSAGSAAIAQKTKATNHMLNQMQQAVAQSDQQFVSPEELFNLYSAQVGAYSEFSEENINNNSNNSDWENAGRASMPQNSGFWSGVQQESMQAAQSVLRGMEYVSPAAGAVMNDILHPAQAATDLAGFGVSLWNNGIEILDLGTGGSTPESMHGFLHVTPPPNSELGVEIGNAAFVALSIFGAGKISEMPGGLSSAEEISVQNQRVSAGLTSRLNRAQIKEYLSQVREIPRDQLISDLESLGLKLRGESPNGLFKTFEDKAGNLRIKIHPPDSSTDYSHLHIYDKAGNSITSSLVTAPFDSSEVHIEIQPIQKELEWRPK